MTIHEGLKGAKGDMLAARVVAPIFFAVIYGLYNFAALGGTQEHYLYTYAPAVGGVASIVGFLIYYLLIVSPLYSKRSWINLLLLLSFLPYLFLLYVVGYLGLYAIYRGALVSFSIWTIFGGLFWMAIGYSGMNHLYLMSEIAKRPNYMEPQ